MTSGQAAGHEGGAALRALDHRGCESVRSADERRRMNDSKIRVQLEFEGVEAEGQSLPDRFQRRFFEAPESVEGLQALGVTSRCDRPGLCGREEPPGELYSLELPRVIFEVDTYRMGQ